VDWEHQALLRARVVAGDPALRERFEALRRDILRFACGGRPCAKTCATCASDARRAVEVGAGEFDLKQDAGGITDIEFLAQYWTLCSASATRSS